MTKCYFGYYRFSVDLDFTWRQQEIWSGLGKKELRRKLLSEIRDCYEKTWNRFKLSFYSTFYSISMHMLNLLTPEGLL